MLGSSVEILECPSYCLEMLLQAQGQTIASLVRLVEASSPPATLSGGRASDGDVVWHSLEAKIDAHDHIISSLRGSVSEV